MRYLSIRTGLLSLAIAFSAALAHGQTAASANITTLCNTGLTPKNQFPAGCTSSSLVYPINPVDGGLIVDGNWDLAQPYPSASYTQPAPNPCTLVSAYSSSPVNQAWDAWFNPSDGLSQWIEPLGGGETLAGWYIYRTQFFVPKAFPGSSAYLLSVSGQFLIDNFGPIVYLENPAGTNKSCKLVATSAGPGQFFSWTPLQFSAAVLPNTLATLYFVVNNSEGGGLNPTGLRVEFSSAVIRP